MSTLDQARLLARAMAPYDELRTDARDRVGKQRSQALYRANEIRLDRAKLRRRIAIGEVSAAQVILDPPSEAESWAVGDLLAAQRRWGSTRARRLLSRQHIVETKPVGALTERQRGVLARALGHRTAAGEGEGQ